MIVSNAVLSQTSRGVLTTPQAEQLLQLMKEHDLNPLDKHSENLNRFLLFIGKPRSTRYQLKQ